MLAAVAVGVVIIAWIVGGPVLRQRRHARAGARKFPLEWLAIMNKRMPVYQRLPGDLREQLQRLILMFLSEKIFVGRGGFTITDEIRVTVAAHACLLLLNRATAMFPLFRMILIYPSTYAVDHRDEDDAGVVSEELQERAGEARGRGPGVLSWG